jgi:RNA polymerase sigma-70 factor (ECF subfamily)
MARATLARIYDRNAALVFGLLLRILGDSGRAKSLLVQVFADLESAGPQEIDCETTAWLVHRGRELALAARPGGVSAATANPPPAAHVVPFCRDSQRVAQVRTRLGQLALLDREMLELAYFRGLGSRVIAERSGLEASEVRARLRQALCSISPERSLRSKEV